MRVFESARSRGMPALLLLALLSCAGPEQGGRAEIPPQTEPVKLRKRLADLEVREDPESLRARAEICELLRASGVPDAAELLIRGAEANAGILSQPAPEALRREAAGKLALAFARQAAAATVSRIEYPGSLGQPLRRLVLLMAAVLFADYALSDQRADLFQKLAETLDNLGDSKTLTAEARAYFKAEVRELLLKSMAARRGAPSEPSPESRKFCELTLQAHLDEGTRNADFGTREKADRSKAIQVVRWYLQALTHFAVARETRMQLSPSQANTLGGQDIVVRSLCDLLCAD